jgi:hypothetical protein
LEQFEPFLDVMTSPQEKYKLFLKEPIYIVFVAENVNLPVLRRKKHVANFEIRPDHGYMKGLSILIFIVTYFVTEDNVTSS